MGKGTLGKENSMNKGLGMWKEIVSRQSDVSGVKFVVLRDEAGSADQSKFVKDFTP